MAVARSRAVHEVLPVVLLAGDQETGCQGGDGGPTEPPERARRDVGDGDVARLALVAVCGKTGHLHQVEVVEQADPGDAGDDVQPARQAELQEGCRREHERQQDGDHETGRDGAANRGQWIHGRVFLREKIFWGPGLIRTRVAGMV